MTSAARKKAQYWREKMMKASVSDVVILPRAKKLSESEITLLSAKSKKREVDAEALKRQKAA